MKTKIPEGWKLVIIPVQHMFPNCNIRYKTNCKDMKSCDKDIIKPTIKIPIPTDYTLLLGQDDIVKPPKGFENFKSGLEDDIKRKW